MWIYSGGGGGAWSSCTLFEGTSYKIFVTFALLDPQAYKMAVAPYSQLCTPLAYTDYAHSVSTIRMAVNEGRLLLSNIQRELRLSTFVQSHKTQSTIIFLFFCYPYKLYFLPLSLFAPLSCTLSWNWYEKCLRWPVNDYLKHVPIA
jgi:hypothetical protein